VRARTSPLLSNSVEFDRNRIFKDVYVWQRIKPKGMHYKTFYQLCKEHDFYERSYLDAFGESINRLNRMIGRF